MRPPSYRSIPAAASPDGPAAQGLSPKNTETTGKLRALFEKAKSAYVSSITMYEIYKQTIASENKTVAKLRVSTISRDLNHRR